MATGKIKTLFSNAEKIEALFPRTKVNAVSDADGTGLDAILDDLNSEISTKATEAFVTNKIAEAQLSGGSGGNIDLSDYATKDDLSNIDFPVDSVNGKTGTVTLSASDVGAAPAGYGYEKTPVVLKSSMVTDETDLDTALEALYSTMGGNETRLIRFYGYPSASDYNWFGFLFKSSNNYGSMMVHAAYDRGSLLTKTKYGGQWLPLEWVNPPMNPGTEYRTTERWYNQPVYAMLVDLGAITTSFYTTVSIPGISGLIRAIPNVGGIICGEVDASAGGDAGKFYFIAKKGTNLVQFYAPQAGSSVVGANLKAQIWYTK